MYVWERASEVRGGEKGAAEREGGGKQRDRGEGEKDGGGKRSREREEVKDRGERVGKGKEAERERWGGGEGERKNEREGGREERERDDDGVIRQKIYLQTCRKDGWGRVFGRKLIKPTNLGANICKEKVKYVSPGWGEGRLANAPIHLAPPPLPGPSNPNRPPQKSSTTVKTHYGRRTPLPPTLPATHSPLLNQFRVGPEKTQGL